MQITPTLKVVLGVAATIVLGAVGSGVWELVFSPSFTWLGRSLLTVVTLGLESVSDAIYVDVAKGHHELPSLIVYNLLGTIILMSLLFGFFVIQNSLLRSKFRQSPEGKTPEQLKGLKRRADYLLIWLLLVMTFLCTTVFVRSVMHTYTNIAVTYFNQCLTIVLPYVSPEEERRLRSEFARISSRKNYEQLVNELREHATSNSIQLPEFSIW